MTPPPAKAYYTNSTSARSHILDAEHVTQPLGPAAIIEQLSNRQVSAVQNGASQSSLVTEQHLEHSEPLISSEILEKLNKMLPNEYRNYILSQLTPEQRKWLMKDGAQRHKTFYDWPYKNISNLNSIQMIAAGFYSLGKGDQVQCTFCQGLLHQWDIDDNPMTEHVNNYPNCSFVRNLECGNRKYESSLLPQDEIDALTLFFTPPTVAGKPQISAHTLGLSAHYTINIKYATKAARLKSFTDWPKNQPITDQEMCNAGFYYIKSENKVRCYCCRIALNDCEKDDNPWEEHARWSPDCEFLKQEKGEEFIEWAYRIAPANKEQIRKILAQRQQEKEHRIQEMLFNLGHTAQHIKQAEQQLQTQQQDTSNFNSWIEQLPALEGNPTIADASTAVDDASMAPSEVKPPAKFVCFSCFQKDEDTTNKARRVATICGHPVFCDDCNTQESEKAKQKPENNGIPCPHIDTDGTTCEQSIKATILVYGLDLDADNHSLPTPNQHIAGFLQSVAGAFAHGNH